MTAPDNYDTPLSGLRKHVEDLAVSVALWEARREPDAHARRCASNAVDAVDAMLASLHQIRAQLASEIRASDDASAARADELLRRRDRLVPMKKHHRRRGSQYRPMSGH
jgi:hypothetical protein